MLSTGCHWLKLQQGPSAEGAVPKYPSRATSSLPYKRKGYSEKPWGDRNTKCLFSPVSFIKGLSLTIVSVLSYCPLQSLAALHPRTHAGSRLLLSRRRRRTFPDPAWSLNDMSVFQAEHLCTAVCQHTGTATEMGQLVFGHSRRWEAFWKSITLPTEFPEAELFYFLLADTFYSAK